MTRAGNRPHGGVTPALMRGLLVLGFLLAVGAIVLAVFSDEVRWLKLAALLGVWAAFTAAFPVVYFRRTAHSAELKTEESKRTYELELHREISARREYEIGVSQAAREDAESRHREELAGLREQLDRLNTTLSGLLDGDLLFERLTLSAESTRVRQVGDAGRNRLANMAPPSQIRQAPEPTGPFIRHQSAATAPVAGSLVLGGPYPVREDDTIAFSRATFGPGAQPVPGARITPAVVEAHVLPEPPVHGVEAELEPELELGAEPELEVQPELEPGPELEPELELEVQPEPEVQPEQEPEPAPVEELGAESEPELEPGPGAGPQAEPGLGTESQAQPERGAEPESETEPERAPDRPTAELGERAEDTDPGHAFAVTGHSSGISVADLLAAYGNSGGPPRRRRRTED